MTIAPSKKQSSAGSNAERPKKVEPDEQRLAAQATFFSRMGTLHQFRMLFDHLPDVHFFAKDEHGRFVASSPGVLKRVGLLHEDHILGLTDADIHPPRIAREIREDDERVMRTREPLIDRVEALFSRSQAKDWYVTTKLPIIDPNGKVIGIMGFVRPFERHRHLPKDSTRLKQVVDYIHQHHRERLNVARIASLACLSQRQLNRKFHETFGMSVQEFVIRTRIQAASDDLTQTDKPIAVIAIDCGFCDQSAFTQQFRKHVGESPLEFRRRNANAPIPPAKSPPKGKK